MGIKCYNKPNRTNPRYFKTCDVARIAQNCVIDTGATRQEVISCVAMALNMKSLGLQVVDLDKDTIDQIKGKFNVEVSDSPGSDLFASGFVRDVPAVPGSGAIRTVLTAVLSTLERLPSFLRNLFGLALLISLIHSVQELLDAKLKQSQNIMLDTKTLSKKKCDCNTSLFNRKL